MTRDEEKKFWLSFGYEDSEVIYSPAAVKGMTMSPISIDKYIDRCLIDEYAKDYSLEISSLPENEQTNFLTYLFKYDPVMKDIALDRMQELLDNRLVWKEVKGRYDEGLVARIDQTNGETYWVKREGATDE